MALSNSTVVASILELSGLLFKAGFDTRGVTMVMLTSLNANHIMLVLFRENLAVLDGLDRGVEVILVNLTIDGGCGLFMTVLGHVLVDHSRSYFLMDCGIMMTCLMPNCLILPLAFDNQDVAQGL